VPVGEWVIRAACRQLRAWRDEGAPPLPVAINVSARQLLQQDLCATIDAALREHGVDAGLLEVEITESTAMQNPERAAQMLRQLRLRRVRVAIDDFGTGYSSLAYLKHFPIDALKLDRSFVKGLPDNAGDIAITQAVIGMARNLGVNLIAEGVETDAQRGFLAHYGCEEMQGYVLSKPLSAPACSLFVRWHHGHTRAVRPAA
jgi:EAL domain-containing protein (putative c-di-GMP-specific phosphodiesterase class I)